MNPVWATAVLAAAPAGASPSFGLAPRDFVEYWAAGRVHLGGGNPYDPADVLPLQRIGYGWPEQVEATMLWAPPWTLPLYWPFAALPFPQAHAAWVAAQVLMVIGSVVLLWAAYRGSVRPAGAVAATLVAAASAPVWWMVAYGQNTGFMLLGLAGFVFCHARGRPGTAGAFAALTAVKPHLLAMFGVALILNGLTRRGWRSLAGGAAVLIGSAVVALVPDPRVYAQFTEALARPPSETFTPLHQWQVPTFSYRLRVLAVRDGSPDEHGEMFWLQFVPCLLGCAAVVPYWWARRRAWDWAVETPRLVFASVLLAPYGAWIFDLTVLLVPVTQAAAWSARAGRPAWSAAAAGGLFVASIQTFNPQLVRELHDMVWFAPVVLALYLGVRLATREGGSSPSPVAREERQIPGTRMPRRFPPQEDTDGRRRP